VRRKSESKFFAAAAAAAAAVLRHVGVPGDKRRLGGRGVDWPAGWLASWLGRLIQGSGTAGAGPARWATVRKMRKGGCQ